MKRIKAVIFDWGDTIMRDFPAFTGPMAYWPRVEVINGVIDVLEHLHQQVICCLASNAGDSDAVLMGLALTRGNIRQYFHHLLTSRELGARKPDPDFYRGILQRLGVEPYACLVVGNDYQKDIVPAKSVGMQTIWFSETPIVSPTPCADAVIHSMDDLIAFIVM